jgi:hypothetical protein
MCELKMRLDSLVEADAQANIGDPMTVAELRFCEKMLDRYDGGLEVSLKCLERIDRLWKQVTLPTPKILRKKHKQYKGKPLPIAAAEIID